jgi:hypothetical protein
MIGEAADASAVLYLCWATNLLSLKHPWEPPLARPGPLGLATLHSDRLGGRKDAWLAPVWVSATAALGPSSAV